MTVISKERESQDLGIFCGWTPSDSLRRPVSRKIFQRFLQNLRTALPQGKCADGAGLLVPIAVEFKTAPYSIAEWKFTPERDVRAEFLKALVRNNKSLAYSLKDEMNILSEDVLSVFYAKGINTQQARHILSEFETREHMEIMRIEEDDETYGLIMKMPGRRSSDTNPKLAALQLFDHLKEGSKTVRIFHATGIDGIEGAADAFRLIGETWTFVESVFPYKRVFTKYELALVINCINLQVQGGHLKKNYMDLLDPFYREMGENKARQLLETLETFVLDAGMNSGKTSTFMGIHTNTVQYRLKRINEVLGAEITGNRVIPGLTMALALKRLERVVK